MNRCKTCKYFAVPLTEEEKKKAHCPGANPLGDPGKKTCVLEGKPDFEVCPEDCKYYFPVFMRFR